MAQKWRKIGKYNADDTQMKMSYTCIIPKWDRAKSAVSKVDKALETVLFLSEKYKEVHSMASQIKKGRQYLKNGYWAMVGALSAMIISLQPVMADTIWDRFSNIMRDIYGQLAGISTIVAVTAAAVALLVRMISRNQRAVDEATSWLKRIVVAWIVLNSLGFVVAYLQPLVSGGQYTG